SYSMAAEILAIGAEPMMLPIAPDERNRLRELIADGLEYDLLLLTGGVSMGKYDLVEETLSEYRAEFLFTRVEIQPGRPVVLGRIPGPVDASSNEPHATYKYFLGLPGNPVSTMVTLELFARPLIEALMGMPPGKLIFSRAKTKSPVKTKTGLKRFLP